MSPELLSALLSELAVIEEELKGYERRAKERDDIKALLREHGNPFTVDKPSAAVSVSGTPEREAEPAAVASGEHALPSGRARHFFQRNDDSKEMRVARAYAKYLAEQTLLHESAYLQGWEAIAPSLPGISREYGRNALRRVGGRVGIIYESADRVRLKRKHQGPEEVSSGP